MRPSIVLSTVLFLLLFISCEKDPYEDLSTSFQGIAYAGPEEPWANGEIVIVGYKSLFDDSPGEGFRQNYKIESDGTFNIRVTTDDVASFSIGMATPTPDLRLSCTGPTISGVCTLMEAGKTHSNIIVYAY